MIEDTRSAYFWREGWNTLIDQCICEKAVGAEIVENLLYRIKLSHRPNLRQVHSSQMK